METEKQTVKVWLDHPKNYKAITTPNEYAIKYLKKSGAKNREFFLFATNAADCYLVQFEGRSPTWVVAFRNHDFARSICIYHIDILLRIKG